MCTVKTGEETKRGHRGHHSVRNGGFLGREKTGGWGSWKYLVQHLPLWNQADEFAFVFFSLKSK